MIAYVDIETLPAVDWNENQRYQHVMKSVPGNYKKPEAIDGWYQENHMDKFLDTSFDYKHGWILCVCIALDDGEVMTFSEISNLRTTRAQLLAAEQLMLQKLEEYVISKMERGVYITWVGWNSDSFDLPWLYRACLRAGCFKLARLIVPRGAQKYKLPWRDLMPLWSCYQYKSWHKQADVAAYLGIREPNPELNGSMVYSQWLAGSNLPLVHCGSDLLTLRELDGVICGV